MTDEQAPTRTDYGRAAALLLHYRQQSIDGINQALADADQSGRLSALVLALCEIALQADDPLGSPAGLAGLRQIALNMGGDDADDPEDPTNGDDVDGYS